MSSHSSAVTSKGSGEAIYVLKNENYPSNAAQYKQR